MFLNGRARRYQPIDTPGGALQERQASGIRDPVFEAHSLHELAPVSPEMRRGRRRVLGHGVRASKSGGIICGNIVAGDRSAPEKLVATTRPPG